MKQEALQKLGLAILSACIFGSWPWIRDIETRLVIIEDDLDEAVNVIGALHPPSHKIPSSELIRTDLKFKTAGPSSTADDDCDDRCKRRRAKLKGLKPGPDNGSQEETPDAGSDPGVVDVPGC